MKVVARGRSEHCEKGYPQGGELCDNSWGRGSGLLADQLYRPSRERIAPAPRFGFAVDCGGSLWERICCHVRGIPKERDARQAGATSEHTPYNWGATAGPSCDRLYAAYVGDAIADREAGQSGAIIEGKIPDAGDSIANCDARQAPA